MTIKFILLIFASVTIMLRAQAKDTLYVDTTKAGIIDTVSADTTGLLNAQKTIAKKDTTTPLYQRPFNSASTFISRKEIDFMDYRYTGDLFDHFGMGFLRNFGFVGHPNELILYGTNAVGFLDDGIYTNNRLSRYYNLNLMASEMIDSIEIIRSPRGFLFGPVSNPVSVNFIKRDIYSLRPYARIKFYEGPGGEAFIDAIFNAIVFPDFIFTFDISNRNIDSSYSNSDFSIWQGDAHLKYLISNDVSLTASYAYNDYNAALNGGVNVDSIVQLTSNIDLILYDNLRAPVYFRQRRTNILQHNVGLRLFAIPFANTFTDFNVYYRFDKNEIINPADYPDFPQSNKNKSAGALLTQDISLAFAELKVMAQYERTDTKRSMPGSQLNYNTNYFTLAPIFSLNLIDSSIVPSFYYKIQNISNGISKVYNGLGFDLSLKLLKHLDLYGGYSIYKSAGLSDNVNTVELSANLNLESVKLRADFINRNESYLQIESPLYASVNEYYSDLGASLLGGNFSLKLWNILFETTAYYDLSKHKSSGIDSIRTIASPQIKLTGGLYLDGSFFDESLYLKTGFAVNYNSKQRYFYLGNEYVLAGRFVTVDYTLVGEIKKRAYAYFTWENLFDETYYIVPYYPMFRRGIRFGVAWELFN
ncbi:MAG TPA: putative porin [Ignavibacteriaceae bacterium]|nr:putative porin [Ignavibacteriaceae bacterium]